MKGRQFEQFSTEVLQRGASAVLPQHLPERWLNTLLEEAEILQQEGSDTVEDTCAGLLSAVLVLYSAQHGHPDTMEIAATTLLRYMSVCFRQARVNLDFPWPTVIRRQATR